MKALQAYQIDIFGLSEKTHNFDFEVGDAFFAAFENSPVASGKLDVALILEKTQRLINLKFSIIGTISLTCDRSLDKFDKPINLNREILVKYGEREEELTDEIVTITRDTQKVNVAQFIYEFITLSLPMKKLHPRFENEPVGDNDIEYTLIYRSEATEEGQEEKPIDPRWEKLKQISNN